MGDYGQVGALSLGWSGMDGDGNDSPLLCAQPSHYAQAARLSLLENSSPNHSTCQSTVTGSSALRCLAKQRDCSHPLLLNNLTTTT